MALPVAKRRYAWASIGAVVLLVVVLVVVKVVSGTGSGGTVEKSAETVAPASVVSAVSDLSASVTDSIGAPGGIAAPSALKGEATLSVGTPGQTKPEVLYVGADFCPYCAAERWPLVVALARFGSFSGLELTTSSLSDAYPGTATFSFHGSSYSSRYLAFSSVELYNNEPGSDGRYTVLERPTAAEMKVLDTFDAPPYSSTSGAIPFLDVANRYLLISSQYSPQVLSGLSARQIASDLANPDSPVAVEVVGSANYLIAAICAVTGAQPASVCSASAVGAASKELG